jgi:hypothetical protein
VILVKIAKPRGSIYGGVVAAPAFAEIAKMAMLHAGVLPAMRALPPARLLPVSPSHVVRRTLTSKRRK